MAENFRATLLLLEVGFAAHLCARVCVCVRARGVGVTPPPRSAVVVGSRLFSFFRFFFFPRVHRQEQMEQSRAHLDRQTKQLSALVQHYDEVVVKCKVTIEKVPQEVPSRYGPVLARLLH